MKSDTKTNEKPACPSHFSAKLRAWWSHYTTEYGLDPSELGILEAMGDLWSEYVGLRKSLKAAGCFTYTDGKGTVKERPELGAMNRCRVTFARLRRELALPVEEPEEMRLPRTNGARN